MKKDKIINYFKNNWTIYIVLFISLVLQLLALKELGYGYTLHSDDYCYIESGITFVQSGAITMQGALSAKIMPGMTFIVGLFVLIFGKGINLWISLKILYLIMHLITIYIVYKSIRLYENKYISAFGSSFLLSIDYIWMSNLILTETPFIMFFALLIYHTLKLSITKSNKDYVLIIIYYIMCLFIRPNIAPYPLCLLIFLLVKKYDIKLLIKQLLIGTLVVILCLAPWTYRNYKEFNKFIPLSYGLGNPLLLGTYEGHGYPRDFELDYKLDVDELMPEKMRYYLNGNGSEAHMHQYYESKHDELMAKYRMKEWWKRSKKTMLFSYLIEKPKLLFCSGFYWNEILGISRNSLMIYRNIEIALFILSSIFIIYDKTRFKEWLFLILAYTSQVAVYSYTSAYSRYAITMYFIRYIVIGIGLNIIIRMIISGRKSNKGTNDNSSI